MLELKKPESGQRKEVYDVSEDLTKLVRLLFLDDDPAKEQIDELVIRILSLVREGSEVVAAVPKDSRVIALLHALSVTGAMTFDEEVKYPDEVPSIPEDRPL
jgi:hypothetical protein